jgi:hypothetical protein
LARPADGTREARPEEVQVTQPGDRRGDRGCREAGERRCAGAAAGEGQSGSPSDGSTLTRWVAAVNRALGDRDRVGLRRLALRLSVQGSIRAFAGHRTPYGSRRASCVRCGPRVSTRPPMCVCGSRVGTRLGSGDKRLARCVATAAGRVASDVRPRELRDQRPIAGFAEGGLRGGLARRGSRVCCCCSGGRRRRGCPSRRRRCSSRARSGRSRVAARRSRCSTSSGRAGGRAVPRRRARARRGRGRTSSITRSARIRTGTLGWSTCSWTRSIKVSSNAGLYVVVRADSSSSERSFPPRARASVMGGSRISAWSGSVHRAATPAACRCD